MSIQSAILRMTIDSSGAKQGASEYTAATDQAKRASAESAAAANKVSDSFDNMGKAAASAGRAADGLAEKNKAVARSTQETVKETGILARSFGLTGYEARNLAFQLNDVFTGLVNGQRSFQVLTQQGPQIIQIFGGMGNALRAFLNPVVAVTAGVLAASAAFTSIITSAEGMNRTLTGIQAQLAVTGRSAELTRVQIRGLIDATALLVGQNRETATASVQAFTSMRQLGGKQIEELTRIVADYAAATGTEVPDAARKLTQGLKDPTAYAAQLAQQFGNLTVEQYRQIEAAQKSGKANEALSLTIKYLGDTVKGTAENAMTPFQKATDSLNKSWESLTSSFKDSSWVNAIINGMASVTQAIADVAKPDSPIEKLQQKIEELRKGRASIDAAANDNSGLGDQSVIARLRRENIENMANAQAELAQLQGRSGARTNGGRIGMAGALANSGVTPDGIFDPQKSSQLLDKYRSFSKNIADVNAEIAQLVGDRSRVAQGSDIWNQYTEAIDRARASLTAIKEPLMLANEALQREADILSKPINQREVYRAKIEATAEALNRGRGAQEAAAMGMIAEEKALLGLRAAFQDQLTAIDSQVEALQKLTAARKGGAAATVQQQAANDAESAKLKNITVDTDAYTAAVLRLKEAQQRDAFTQQLAAQRESVSLAQQEMQLVGLTSNERAIEVSVLQKRQQLARDFPNIAAEEREGIIGLMKEQMALNQEAAKLNSIYDQARDSLGDVFGDVLTGGIKKFSDFAGSVKNIFVRLAAQIAQTLVFQPILNNILGGGSVLFGAGGVGASGVAGSAGGLISGLGSIGSSISDALGLGSGTSLLNSLGTSLGFGSGLAQVAPAGFVGPMPLASGSLFGTTTLGGLLGGIGAGFGAGSVLNGLIGGNSTGGTIGSGVGSLAGAAIGSIVPGIGTLLGGLLGGAGGGIFGGLFGPKKSVGPNANTNLNIRGGRLFVGETGADNGGDRAGTIALAEQAVGALNSLFDAYGISAYDPYGGRLASPKAKENLAHGIGFEVYTGAVNAGKPQTPDDVLKFMLQRGLIKSDKAISIEALQRPGLYSASGGTAGSGGSFDPYQQVIERTKSTTIVEFAKDLDIAKLIDQARNFKGVMSEVEKGFKTLSEQADEYAERGKALGFTQKQIFDALAVSFNQTISDTIMGIEDPFKYAMDQLLEDQKARLEYAKKIGADIVQIEKLNLLEQQALIEQFGTDTVSALQQMSDDLKSWLDRELLGQNSSLTPYQQFTEAQGQFGRVVDAARGAGAGADIGSVTSAADSLLGIARNVLGGATADYSALEAMVRSMIQSLGKELKLPGFWTGGEFTIGGSGGPDSQVVAFKGTPGEDVRVSTPMQRNSDGVNLQVIVAELQRSNGVMQKELREMNRNLASERRNAGVFRK